MARGAQAACGARLGHPPFTARFSGAGNGGKRRPLQKNALVWSGMPIFLPMGRAKSTDVGLFPAGRPDAEKKVALSAMFSCGTFFA